jgi:hypothetical protein
MWQIVSQGQHSWHVSLLKWVITELIFALFWRYMYIPISRIRREARFTNLKMMVYQTLHVFLLYMFLQFLIWVSSTNWRGVKYCKWFGCICLREV